MPEHVHALNSPYRKEAFPGIWGIHENKKFQIAYFLLFSDVAEAINQDCNFLSEQTYY